MPEDFDLPKELDIEQQKQLVDMHISEDTGLHGDIFNAWASLFYIGETDEEAITGLRPRDTYEAHFHARKEPEVANYVLASSRQNSVLSYNSLVMEFNGDLERIKKEKDHMAVRSFYDRAKELVRGLV